MIKAHGIREKHFRGCRDFLLFVFRRRFQYFKSFIDRSDGDQLDVAVGLVLFGVAEGNDSPPESEAFGFAEPYIKV